MSTMNHGTGDKVLTQVARMDRLQRLAMKYSIPFHRINKEELHIYDEVFVLCTKQLRQQWVDVSDWTLPHFNQWLGY